MDSTKRKQIREVYDGEIISKLQELERLSRDRNVLNDWLGAKAILEEHTKIYREDDIDYSCVKQFKTLFLKHGCCINPVAWWTSKML